MQKHREMAKRYMVLSFVAAIPMVAGCVDEGDEQGNLGSTEQMIGPVEWTNVVGVSAVGNSLTKTGPSGQWNAGAVSIDSNLTDGFVEFSTSESNTAKMAGLSNGDTNQNFADIDFAVSLKSNGRIGVYESGVVIPGNFGAYVAGDVFHIEVVAGAVTYAKNGAVFYTSTGTPSGPMSLDTSFLTTGGTITNASVVSTTINWINVVNCSVTGIVLTKTAPSGLWNAGASSWESLHGDGSYNFFTGETNTAKMAGLSNGDTNQNFADIDFAVSMKSNGKIGVYESGVAIPGNFGSYIAGDFFTVSVSGGVISYAKNGVTFYTSTGTPTFPLRADTSFLTTGGTID
jgi:hypothetical protein